MVGLQSPPGGSVQVQRSSQNGLDPAVADFYRRALTLANRAGVPFLVGGAYALQYYTGICRHTKDFDVFVRPRDRDRLLCAFAAGGCQTEVTFTHWLGKAFCGDDFVDVIYGAGNGIAMVDDEWFAHAVDAKVLGMPVRLSPVEEMIWSKAFVQERERFDGADITHLIRARGNALDWSRLLRRMDSHWPVLLSHLLLYRFIYPSERAQVPGWVLSELLGRSEQELSEPPESERVCRGTLLSREQYLTDVEEWGFADARRVPHGTMSDKAIAQWTAAIERDGH
jgi:hypothetical protein